MKNFSPISPVHISGQEYIIDITAHECRSKLNQYEYPAQMVMNTIRDGIFDDMMEGCAVFQSAQTNIDVLNDGFQTKLELIIYDLELFKDRVAKFTWSSYSREFDSLLEETLKR
jgi:hypothetical protein